MTLTELSYYFRKTAPFAILTLIVVFILYYSVQLLILIAQLNRPPEQAAQLEINPVFNVIPRPILPESTPSANYTYTLDSIEGVPVTATSSAQVFFLPKSTATFGFRENIYVMAKTLGFNTELTKYDLNGNEAVFTEDNQTLKVDITNYNFTYEYTELAQDDGRLNDARMLGEEEILRRSKEILNSVGRYPGELARGRTNLIYLAFNPQTRGISVVETPESANLVEVDFYRPDIGEFPIVSPRYFNSQNYMILFFDSTGERVIRSQIRFFEKSEEQVGVYPIKTGEQAWEALRNGKGYVVSAAENVTDISIKRMFMGYLDPGTYQEYLQPVYVFLGENNFAAYVPALTDEWLTEATASATIRMQTEQESSTSAEAESDIPEEEIIEPTIEPEFIEPTEEPVILPTEVTPTRAGTRTLPSKRTTPTILPGE